MSKFSPSLLIVNQTRMTIPKKSLEKLWTFLSGELSEKCPTSGVKIATKYRRKFEPNLTLVFLSPAKARALNLKYRQKDYATDVLSFPSLEQGVLGELVLCPQVLKRQALEHSLSFQVELAYMVIHGVLHLLGMDHEKSPRGEREMMKVQDYLFEKHLRSF